MLKFKKFFTCFVLTLILVSSSVFATDINNNPVDDVADTPLIAINETATTTNTSAATTINEDKYIYNTDSYTLSDIVYGNIFASTNKFVTNPRNNGGIINGDLFVVSSEVAIESDVTLSDKTDKNGTYLIDSINSKSLINGNVYAVSETFTLEAGSEIYGDLYVASTKLNIEPNAVVHGNIFTTATTINFAGQAEGSVYVTAQDFNMTYFGYIGRDLYLNTTNATLDGVVYRNAFITAEKNLTTKTNFKVNQELTVNFAENLTMSGKFNGNVSLNVKNLTLKNDSEESCVIRGNLKYATQNETQIPDGIVAGEVTTAKFENKISKEVSVASLTLNFVTLLVYVFAVVFFSKLFASKAMEKLPELNLMNTLKALGLGVASMFAVFVLFVVLCLLGVGVSLAFFLVIAYLFLVGLAVPLFFNKIAESLKFKLNSYVKLLLVTAVAFLVKLIPVVGSAVMFIVLLIGMGNVLLGLFKRNK